MVKNVRVVGEIHDHVSIMGCCDCGLKFRSDGCFMENMLGALLPAVGNKIRRYYLICQRRCDSGVTARVLAVGKRISSSRVTLSL